MYISGDMNLQPTEGLFQGMVNLKALILDHNDFSDVSVDTFLGLNPLNLLLLDLSYNNLSSLPTQDSFLRPLGNLLYLNLSGNPLKKFANTPEDGTMHRFVSGLPKLQSLRLASCPPFPAT